MRIATWNINDIRKRLPLLLAWLDVIKPDVVALQELKCEETGFPRQQLQRAGYGSLVVGQRTWNGVAILAREAEPVPVRRSLPGDSSDKQARYIEAAIDGILVCCLYAPNGNPYPSPKYDYKLAWLERLLAHSRSLLETGHPVALIGDFNVVPTDADIYSPKTWLDNALLQPEARAAYARLLKQGWTDSIRKAHPHDPMYTFWDYRRNRWERNAGLRIDHVLLSKTLAKRLAVAGVDREVRGMENASDHAPTWVELS